VSDTVSDTLTAIRNASRLAKPFAELRTVKIRVSIVDALKRSGYIWDYDFVDRDGAQYLRVALKYGQDGECAIRSISSVSKPGNRKYKKCSELQMVLQGLGISLLSTNRGIITDKEARSFGVGGEVICTVF
jgi:small subunit ribosomal protein S8